MIDLNYIKMEYEKLKQRFGADAYTHISELFDNIRQAYKAQYLKSPRALRLKAAGKTPDAEQSWKVFKGKNFEKLIHYVIQSEIQAMDLASIPGDTLNRKVLPRELSRVSRNLLIRYGDYAILPDADLVVYDPNTCRVIAIISCKITLRERIAQTAYWKLKLAADPVTMHIKGLFVTADEDRALVQPLSKERSSRSRIIVEHDLDGTYVLDAVSESDKVKPFSKLIEDLRRFLDERTA